ncbi:MAG TPA: tripartite tricarboxylate transporter substrate binding protein [Burkholderiaceae bacterium]|nr:tripartite tricarboxylate transporter substrate binding protein [Burkholderiaceae bacterium]
MSIRSLPALFALLAACVLALPTSGAAETFPSKPIRLIVPYPPGGTTDVQARLIAKKMSELSGANVIVENKSGAGGNIGVDAVVKAPADGYTIGITAMNSFAINPHLTKKLPYDVQKEVQPLTLVGGIPNVVVVNPELKAANLSELVALSKSTPLAFATPGAGTSVHLTGELLIEGAGLKMQHVPYRGDAPALQDVLGGRVGIMIGNLPGVIEYIRSGRLRPIAVTTAQRSEQLPEVPTLAESGVSGFDVKAYFGLFTAAGTPPAVLTKLHGELVRAINAPDVRERLTQLGIQVQTTSMDEMKRLIQEESQRWGEVVRKTGASWD